MSLEAKVEALTEEVGKLVSEIRSGQGSVERDATKPGPPSGRGGGGSTNTGSVIEKMFKEIVGATASNLGLQNVQALMNQIGELVDPDGPLGQIRQLQEEMGGLAGDMGAAMRDGASIADTYSDALFEVNERLNGIGRENNALDNALHGMGISLKSLLGPLKEANAAMYEMAAGSKSSANGFAILGRSTKEEIADMTLEMGVFGERMGLQTREISTFVQRQIDLTGKAGTDLLREAAIASRRVAGVTKDSSKDIMNIVEALIGDTRRYGNVSVQEAARIGASLRQLGLDYGELSGVVDKFFNFDSAVQSVSALTSVFGVQLDAMDMMMMANEDQGAMMEYLREQFLATGKSVDDMSLAEKRLVQQQLGLSDIAAVERLFDPDADLKSMEELGSDADLKAGDVKSSIMELEQEIRKFGSNTQDIIGRIGDASFDTATAAAQRNLATYTAKLEEFVGDAEVSAQDLGKTMRTSLELDEFEASLDERMKKITKGVSLGVTEAFEGVTKAIIDSFKNVLKEMKEEGWFADSPSEIGLMMSSGIQEAFDTLPASARVTFNTLSDAATADFDAMIKTTGTKLNALSVAIGETGVEFKDLSEAEINQMMERYSLEGDAGKKRLEQIMDSNANEQAVKQRNLAQDLEAQMRAIKSAYGDDPEEAMRQAQIARGGLGDDFKSITDAHLRLMLQTLDEKNKDGASIYQDTAFQAFAQAAKKQAEQEESEQGKVTPLAPKDSESLEETAAAGRETVRQQKMTNEKLDKINESLEKDRTREEPLQLVIQAELHMDNEKIAQGVIDAGLQGVTSSGGVPVKLELSLV